MEKKRQVCMWYVMLFTVLVISNSSLSGEESKQQDFIDLWNKVRTAVVEKNLEEFKNLIVSADPEETEKMTQEDFAEFAEYFLIDSFPEWSSVKLLKFDQKGKAAILVLQLHMDSEEWKDWLVLYGYHFILTENGWKMSGNLYDKSLDRSGDAEENQRRIGKELKENPDLQLESD